MQLERLPEMEGDIRDISRCTGGLIISGWGTGGIRESLAEIYHGSKPV